jgi:hypothetical protein
VHEYVISCAKSYIKWVKEGYGYCQQKFYNNTEEAHPVTNTMRHEREFASLTNEYVEILGDDCSKEESTLCVFGCFRRVADRSVGEGRYLIDFTLTINDIWCIDSKTVFSLTR